jgi:hypothetical protein
VTRATHRPRSLDLEAVELGASTVFKRRINNSQNWIQLEHEGFKAKRQPFPDRVPDEVPYNALSSLHSLPQSVIRGWREAGSRSVASTWAQ